MKKKRVEGTSSTEGTKAGEGSKAVEKTDTDFGDIVLFGEAENEVEVYDSCDGDEIRRKIRQYLSKTGMSQAAFAREIGKSFHPEKKISGLCSILRKKRTYGRRHQFGFLW
ncbi:hypothetical protein WAI453_006732 [Rhynchosporium graminicola]